MEKEKGMTYKKAGVNIKEADRFTAMIREKISKAWPDAGKEIGGFAGGGPIPPWINWVDGSVDGVGTKLKIAALMRQLSTIGQDAVAMSAVDGFINNSDPEYLFDYLAVEKLDADYHIQIIDGLIAACKLAGCKLVGGETAEMPGFFKYPWLFDLTTMVISFKDTTNPYVAIEEGFDIYGWESHGAASNGYSLFRKVFNLDDYPSKARKRLEKRLPELGNKTLGECLLEPTPIWISAIKHAKQKGVRFGGHAHMTGGGIENIPRALTGNLKAVINRSNWARPAIFALTQKRGNISTDEMEHVSNNGIMVVSFVDPSGPAIDGRAIRIGTVEKRKAGEKAVKMTGRYNEE